MIERVATDVTLILGRMIPMIGDVLFQVVFLISLERAMNAVETVLVDLGAT